MTEKMSEFEVLELLEKMSAELDRRADESLKKLKVAFDEFMKMPLEERLKRVRNAMDYESH